MGERKTVSRLQRGEGFPRYEYNVGMKKRPMPYWTFHLRVDDKGRLKLPPVIQEALGEQREVAIISDARKTVRIYPFRGAISRRTIIGRKPTAAGPSKPVWRRLVLVPNAINLLLNLEPCISGFMTTIDSCGRVLVAPRGLRERSEVELENEEVYFEWRRDHFLVTTTDPRTTIQTSFSLKKS